MKKVKTRDEKIAMKISYISIIENILLSAFKLFAGIFAKSSAMISDAVHSASDVFSTFVVIIGVKLSNRDADKSHPYGHERLECVAAIILAMTLVIVGLGIGISGIVAIGGQREIVVPGKIALVAAVISILVKEVMYWMTRNAAKKIDSSALMADAWHHRSDALSSIGSLIGILGARMGYPILDPIASFVISIFIVKAGVDIFIDAIKKMTDEACDSEIIEKIKDITLTENGVLGIDDIKTRKFASKIYIDIEISADGEKTLTETHKIAEAVHDHIENEIKMVKHCMVHVNPC